MTADGTNPEGMVTGEMPSPAAVRGAAMDVHVRRGDGLVARTGSLLAVLGAGADGDDVLGIIERFDAARQNSGDLLALARSLPADASIAVVLVAAHVDLLLLGDVRCDIDGPDGPATFTGSAAAQLVGLPDELATLTLMLSAATTPANQRTALGEGITPGGGIEVTFSGTVDDASSSAAASALPPPPPALAPPAAGAPVPPPPPMPPSASVAVVNVLLEAADEDDPERAPLPETPEEVPAADLAAKVIVRGLACGVGHVNRDDAPYCSACGRRLQGTVNLVSGPRPSLGTLIFDDGTAFGLEYGYVIGREPGIDPAIAAGSLQPLPLDDPERTISRVHADVRLDGWDTTIVDRASANGTHVAVPGGDGWQRLTPDVPVVLGDGWSVAVGRRTFVFQQR